jgi:hypothetical protein
MPLTATSTNGAGLRRGAFASSLIAPGLNQLDLISHLALPGQSVCRIRDCPRDIPLGLNLRVARNPSRIDTKLRGHFPLADFRGLVSARRDSHLFEMPTIRPSDGKGTLQRLTKQVHDNVLYHAQYRTVGFLPPPNSGVRLQCHHVKGWRRNHECKSYGAAAGGS